MLKSILRSIFQRGDDNFESYYQRVLESASSQCAPTASEAKADYMRTLRERSYGVHI